MLGTFGAWRLGTLQARALPFAQALADRGIRTTILTTPWDTPSEAGIIDVRRGVAIVNTTSVSTRRPLLPAWQQARWINDLQPAVVHVFKPKGFGALAARLVPASIPVVVDSDDWEGDGGWNDVAGYSWAQQRVFHHQEQDLIRRSNGVTAASSLLQYRAMQLRPGKADSVTLIDNGLSAARASALQQARVRLPSAISPPVVVLYSRFAEFGQTWLNEFCHALAARFDGQVVVRVIGRNRIPADPPASIGRVHVEWMGYVATDEVPPLLGTSTVAVYPYVDSLITRSKQSVKLLELMAAGCPIIASDVGDVARTIANTGRLVHSADPQDFAQQVREVLSQPEQLDWMSNYVVSRVRTTYNFIELTRKLVDFYVSLGLCMRATDVP
jgi:glycosyltransferase involved in cell wall biosynthesis